LGQSSLKTKGSFNAHLQIDCNRLGTLRRTTRSEFARSAGTSQEASAGESNEQPAGVNDNLIDRYDFGAQLNELQDTNSLQRGAQTVNPSLASAPASPATAESAVPAGFKPKTDVQLTKTAQETVQMSEKWMSEHNQPAVGRDGRVLYSYGSGLPTVVCAPLRVCMIELQSGEKLVGEPQIGDSVRWNLSPALYGSGASSTSVIVIKPQGPGFDTNLLITTDRRAYYLPMRRDNIWRKSMYPKLKPVGLEWATFQVMRRTFATLSKAAGVDAHTRPAQMGNTVDVNENEYAVASFEQKLAGVRKLESVVIQ
jgi:type IV secretory pathway VirB9-like protein